jgi:outer membrane lipoprotein
MMRPDYSLTTTALLFCLTFLTLACAPPFPREMQERVNKNLSFGELKKSPDKYRGTWVMIGGMIVGAKNTRDGVLIEVLQQPLDTDGRLVRTDESGGRFLVQSSTFLDTAIYAPGRELTVIAEVLGGKELPLDEITYQYLLCDAKSLHLWSTGSGPRFFFGVGVSHRL